MARLPRRAGLACGRAIAGVVLLAGLLPGGRAQAESLAILHSNFPHDGPLETALLVAGILLLLIACIFIALLLRQSRRKTSDLRKSNDRLNDYVEVTSDWVWQTDADHRFIFLSPRFTAETGIALETAIGRSPFEISLSCEYQKLEEHRDRIAARAPFRNLEYRLEHPDGGERWFSANGKPLFDENGAFAGYIGATRNITDEVLRIRRHDDSQAITSHLFDAVPDAIIFCSPERRIVKVNPTFTALFGYTLEEARNRTTEFLYASKADYKAAGKRTFNLGSENRIEPQIWRMRRKDGTILTVDVVGSRVVSAAGEVLGNVGVLRDITEREEANEALRRAKETAELANRSKSQFLAHMSHELRTPLNAILGFSEMLQLEMFGKLGDTRYAGYVDDIHGSGALLLAMINDILDLSRIEAGKLELYERDIDPDHLIEECLRFLQDRAARRGITIQNGDSVRGVSLFADERLVKQMLLNLLSNSVKFTPPEGIIRVFVTLDDAGDLRIAVADTGIGIAPEDVQRVRQPFAQAHNVWHKTGEGAGIGLYLVDSLVQAHGGSMHIASEVGNGTIVTLRFPPSRVRLPATGGDKSGSNVAAFG